jgi:hypothetical protein
MGLPEHMPIKKVLPSPNDLTGHFQSTQWIYIKTIPTDSIKALQKRDIVTVLTLNPPFFIRDITADAPSCKWGQC